MNNVAALNVSKLCLGTMTFGEQNSYEDARAQLNLANESGINFIDTAEMYPVPQRAQTQGKSEIYVGRWLKEAHISRDRVVVATKVIIRSRDQFSFDPFRKLKQANLEAFTGNHRMYKKPLLTHTDAQKVDCGCRDRPGLIQADIGVLDPVSGENHIMGHQGHHLGNVFTIHISSWPDLGYIHSLDFSNQASGPSGQMTWIRGGPPSLDAKNIQEAINGSLKRLGCDYIDLYQLHWPDRYVPMFGDVDYDPTARYLSVPIEEQLEALSRAKEAGKIRYIGVSNETAYGVMEFCRLADSSTALPRIVTIQNAYNLLCRTFDSTLAECCHHQQVSLLAYSPLAMGLLSGKYLNPGKGPDDARLNLYRGRYAEAECRYSLSKPNCIPAVTAYVDIARRHGINPVALAIGFVLQNPLVMSAVIGATKQWQLREIVEASEFKLTAELLSEINTVHERYPNPTP